MVCYRLRNSNVKVSAMLCSYLRLFVFVTSSRLIVSSEFTQSLFQNPGKNVNFYGKIQSNPTTNELSSENAYDNLIEPECAKRSNKSDCERDKLYHYPGILCQIENPIPCDYAYPYRTYDGSCNNPHSSRLGMKNQCYDRFLPAYYEGYDGFRKSVKGGPLPEPREISVKIFKDRHHPSVNVSSQFVYFAEYVFLDLLHTVKPNIDCSSKTNANNPDCKPISVSSNDPFYSQFNKTSIDFKRSGQCSCKTEKRAAINDVSFYMDASQLYGVSESDVMKIRALDGTGKLRHPYSCSSVSSGKNPSDASCPKEEFFKALDPRSRAHSLAESQVTIFMREHNRIATALKQINPRWGEEKLFQEARKILIAEYQCIFFRDLLPILLSPRIIEEFDLTVPADASGMQYNSSIIPGTFNEFATSSYRIHSMVPRDVGSFNLRTKHDYSNPESFCSGNVTQFMKGIRQIPAEQYNRYMVVDLTDYLFQQPGVPYGKDLVAITIQRGRDHGLAPYIEVVKFCSEGSILISSFDDLTTLGLMPKENTDLLKQIYASVEDIDMHVGIQLENHISGGVTGPTATCINAKQFYFIQKADRFYFDLVGPEAPFTEDQRKALKKCSWSRILCDNTDISQITKNPFILPSEENSEVPCNEIPKIDLKYWKDNRNNAKSP